MHLPLSGSETGLFSYYQFNDGSGTTLTDIVGGNNGTLVNMTNDDWITSTIPFGNGYSDSQTEATGSVDFLNTGLSMNFSSQNGAEIIVTRIDTLSNVNPTEEDIVFDNQYWVVNRYGSGSFNTDLTFTISENLTAEDESNPFSIGLYTRSSTADSNWVHLMDASSINAANNEATFAGITGFSQFIIAKTPKLIMLYHNSFDLVAFNFGNILVGNTSTKVYNVEASNLIANLEIACPLGYKVSQSENSGYVQNLSISPTNGQVLDSLYVRFEPIADQTYSGNISHSSTSTETKNIAVNGTGVGSTDDFPGNALEFDGVDDYVETTLNDLSGSAITIEYWFKGSSTQSAVGQQNGGFIVSGWEDKHIIKKRKISHWCLYIIWNSWPFLKFWKS